MSEIKTGGPAFPVFQLEQFGEVVQEGSAGLTMRDYFAAKALQGLLTGQFSVHCHYNLKELPEEAYAIADAMIKARGEQ